MNNKEVSIINNISLEVREKEFLSIVGQSGSGKSTLLYLLSGLEPITSGEIQLFGENLSSMEEEKKCEYRRTKIGFVYQFFNLINELNIRDNILMSSLIGKEKVDTKRLMDIVELVGLKDYLKSYPSQLSGGQQQRVAVARAVYAQPEIIFADEPTGNLDSKSGKEIMDMFRMINESFGTTIVLVTHSEEHAKYASRIISILDGTIVEDTSLKRIR